MAHGVARHIREAVLWLLLLMPERLLVFHAVPTAFQLGGSAFVG
jgi:hypothetical protein